jgi:uncharacterized protein (TIGR02265 family)
VSTQGRSLDDPFAGRPRDEVLAEIGRHCDIQDRVSLVPPSAKVRGVFFRSIDSALAEVGLYARYRELFPREVGTLQWQPCTDFLWRLVVGGALLRGAAGVHEGMAEIGRHNALEFASSLLGRILLRFLSREPKKLLMQAIAGRRQTCDYGHWEIDFPEQRTAIVTMREEYLYMESYAVGSARGTFEAIGRTVDVVCELDTRFDGRHVLRW